MIPLPLDRLAVIVGGEHRERHAELAVEAPRAGGGGEGAEQLRVEGVLDDGLAVAAGDRHHPPEMRAAVPGSQPLQGGQRRVDGDGRQAGRRRVRPYQRRRGPVGGGLAEEVVAVRLAAGQGDEERPPRQAARVDGDGLDDGSRRPARGWRRASS